MRPELESFDSQSRIFPQYRSSPFYLKLRAKIHPSMHSSIHPSVRVHLSIHPPISLSCFLNKSITKAERLVPSSRKTTVGWVRRPESQFHFWLAEGHSVRQRLLTTLPPGSLAEWIQSPREMTHLGMVTIFTQWDLWFESSSVSVPALESTQMPSRIGWPCQSHQSHLPRGKRGKITQVI